MHSKSWPKSREISNERRRAEDRLLSDLVAHDGWEVFTRMVDEHREGLLTEITTEAYTDRDMAQKERLVRVYNELSRMLSRVLTRASRYRKEIGLVD